MMTEYDALIEQAISGEEVEQAVRELVRSGPEALAQVMRVVNERQHQYLSGLCEVIRRSTYAEAVPILRANAHAQSYTVLRSVYLALVCSGDEEALNDLVGRLADPTELSTTRSAVAEALFGTRDQSTASVLRAVLAEQQGCPDNPEWPVLLVNTAIALATTNDHSGATALYLLLSSREDTARALAVKALRVVVDREAFRHLERAIGDPSAEVRLAAVDPLFLLGSPRCADLLLKTAERDVDAQVRNTCVIRFGDIMGLAIGGIDDLEFAKEEWHDARGELAGDTCYRFAEPIALPNLLEEFAEEPGRRTELAEELQLLTGVDIPSRCLQFGPDHVSSALSDVELIPGRVHKWGHPQAMPAGADSW